MTKKEIVRKIAAEVTLSQSVVQEIVQRTFEEIIDAMTREGRIELRNFGVFEVKMRAARQARNPQTNERLDLPPRLVVAFRPGKEMADRVAALPLSALTTTFQRHLAAPRSPVGTDPETADDSPSAGVHPER